VDGQLTGGDVNCASLKGYAKNCSVKVGRCLMGLKRSL
jgi:hypothetical protein